APDHHVAVREVDHAHDAEDQGQPHRHEAVDASEEQAVQQPLRDEGRIGQRLDLGKTYFCAAASRGHTTTGLPPSTWIMAVEAFGLSPISLKTTGPAATMRLSVYRVLRMASTTA